MLQIDQGFNLWLRSVEVTILAVRNTGLEERCGNQTFRGNSWYGGHWGNWERRRIRMRLRTLRISELEGQEKKEWEEGSKRSGQRIRKWENCSIAEVKAGQFQEIRLQLCDGYWFCWEMDIGNKEAKWKAERSLRPRVTQTLGLYCLALPVPSYDSLGNLLP